MAQRLKHKQDTIQLLEANIGKIFSDINLRNNMPMGPNQTDKLLHSKGNHKKNPKRQLTEWEKIVSNDAMDKDLISRIYKQFIQPNSKKANHPREKWAKDSGQLSQFRSTFLQGRYTDGQQTHEKMLNIPDYKRNANHNYHEIDTTSHQSEWPSLINTQITSAGGAVEKREPPCTAGGHVHWYSHYGEHF